jgi:hypothetical protein
VDELTGVRQNRRERFWTPERFGDGAKRGPGRPESISPSPPLGQGAVCCRRISQHEFPTLRQSLANFGATRVVCCGSEALGPRRQTPTGAEWKLQEVGRIGRPDGVPGFRVIRTQMAI